MQNIDDLAGVPHGLVASAALGKSWMGWGPSTKEGVNLWSYHHHNQIHQWPSLHGNVEVKESKEPWVPKTY